MRLAVLAGLVLAALVTPAAAAAQGRLITVRMVDVSATEFKFEPAAIDATPGDTVRFVQTTATPHNVEFRDMPAGTNLGAARMGTFLVVSGQTYDVVIDRRFAVGVHKYVCTPHESMGMLGQVTVAAN